MPRDDEHHQDERRDDEQRSIAIFLVVPFRAIFDPVAHGEAR